MKIVCLSLAVALTVALDFTNQNSFGLETGFFEYRLCLYVKEELYSSGHRQNHLRSTVLLLSYE